MPTMPNHIFREPGQTHICVQLKGVSTCKHVDSTQLQHDTTLLSITTLKRYQVLSSLM